MFIPLTNNDHRSNFGSRFSHWISCKVRNMTAIGPQLASLNKKLISLDNEETELNNLMVELRSRMATVNGRLAKINKQKDEIYGIMTVLQDGDSSFLSSTRNFSPPEATSPPVVFRPSNVFSLPLAPKAPRFCTSGHCGCGMKVEGDGDKCGGLALACERRTWSTDHKNLCCKGWWCRCVQRDRAKYGCMVFLGKDYLVKICADSNDDARANARWLNTGELVLPVAKTKCNAANCLCDGKDFAVKAGRVRPEDPMVTAVCKASREKFAF